jgi:hypothetical protein
MSVSIGGIDTLQGNITMMQLWPFMDMWALKEEFIILKQLLLANGPPVRIDTFTYNGNAHRFALAHCIAYQGISAKGYEQDIFPALAF